MNSIPALFNPFGFNLAMIALFSTPAHAAIKITFSDPETARSERAYGAGVVYVEGEVSKGDTDRFLRSLKEQRFPGGIVDLHSAGGDLFESLKLGRTIRSLHLSTRIGRMDHSAEAICLSACTYAYMGGKFRFFKNQSKFGVHRFYSARGVEKDAMDQAQIVSAELVNYFSEMGIRPEVYRFYTEAGPAEIREIPEQTLKEFNVVNNGASPPSWAVDSMDGETFLRGRQSKWTGDGGVLLYCKGRNRIQISGVYGPVTNAAEIKAGTGRHEIIIDDDHFALNGNPVAVQDQMMVGLYTLSPELVDRILGAKKNVGWSLLSREVPGLFFGISVDLTPTGIEKVNSFIRSCGFRPGWISAR